MHYLHSTSAWQGFHAHEQASSYPDLVDSFDDLVISTFIRRSGLFSFPG